jgi:DNA-binding NarL/FixJ family response regulator
VVGEAQNGEVAIQQAKLLYPDVILMDLEMPVLNGFIATQCIKSLYPSIFIIILTIHDDPATRQKAAQAGADAFIEKSAPPDGLIREISGFHQQNFDKELL